MRRPPNISALGFKLALLGLLGLLALSGCQTTSDDGPFEVAPVTFAEMKEALLREDAVLEHFDQPGPFRVSVRANVSVKLSRSETVQVDIIAPERASKAPLVIISHGNHSRKEAHRYQAERIASFGMYAVVVQLPNRKRWVENGATIARLTRKLAKSARLFGKDAELDGIILAGHSFGGSAITVAAGRGAPVRGLILLDPAVVSDTVQAYMRKVRQPVMLLGADRRIFRSRKRRMFYKDIGGEMVEVSVRGATHDDAQYPSMFAISALGVDPYTSRQKQTTFSAAIAATAFSIAATGGLDYVWEVVRDQVASGDMKLPRRRAPRLAGAVE